MLRQMRMGGDGPFLHLTDRRNCPGWDACASAELPQARPGGAMGISFGITHGPV